VLSCRFFPPGGPTDTHARILADKLQAAFGQPFIVENKVGATGIVGTSFVANAPADGYTLLFGSNSSHVISSPAFSASRLSARM
jgi:tripartite-type tricarboxylate transporter receptor subunit TctC